MSLDNDLRNALRRVPAPEGFADRVMKRVAADASAAGGRERPPLHHWWRAAAATFLLAAILGGWGAHEMIERRREAEAGRQAREQVLLALRITGEKLAHAQRGVRHITGQ